MKKTRNVRRRRTSPDEILPEYDFSRAAPNRFAERFHHATIVTIDPDVATVFRTADEVNDALRALAGVIRQHARRRAQPRKK